MIWSVHCTTFRTPVNWISENSTFRYRKTAEAVPLAKASTKSKNRRVSQYDGKLRPDRARTVIRSIGERRFSSFCSATCAAARSIVPGIKGFLFQGP